MALATLVLFALYLLFDGLHRLGLPPIHHRIQQLWARTGLFVCGLQPEVVGRRMRRGGALVSNHVSWIDIFTLLSTGRVNFVAKAEVRRWPGVGFLASATGTMFIERKAAAARRQQEEMRARIEAGQLLCFFPEGTSTDGLRVLDFKSSLFGVFMTPELRETMWLQPVTLIYRPPAGAPAELYGWWGDMPFGKNIWDIVTHSFGGRVTVVFHQERRAAEFADRKLLARDCGAAVAEGMKSGEVQGMTG
ncbi:MAG: 1-acyl-sn-glycerol-3-phosphate acyltransferase [Alphaproteobacteria bacterium]|nr:MAG: 1-acyl-sn-glycerol-3-phosphate acyltransferase [Alphaproteobacteria bacterium]